MSSRPYLQPHPIFTNQTMGATVSSSPLSIATMSLVGFDISWTGAPVGTFSIEVSNTYEQFPGGQVKTAGNWTALTLSAAVAPAGTPSNGFIDIDSISATWIRLTYTRTSGTGVLNATVSGKSA